MNKNNFVNLGFSFRKICKRFSNNIALQFNEEEKYSYSDLNKYSNKILELFKILNLKKDDVIAIESYKNIISYSIIVACWKSGVVYSFFDTDDNSERIKKIFNTLKPKKIFTFKKRFFKGEVYLKKNYLNHDDCVNESFYCLNNNKLDSYIMFTSGSTGFPKGVVISHKNLSYFIKWSKSQFNIDNNSILSNLNPLHFDNSVFDIYSSFLNGACLIPVNKKELFEPENLLRKLKKLKCSIWFSVPSLLSFFLNISDKKFFKLLNLKFMIFGGERFPINSIKKILKYLNRTNIFNVSGPTECTCICSAHKVTKKEILNLKNIPVGKINSYFGYKLFTENEEENHKGELYLEGPAVSKGYYNNKKATNKNFYKKGSFSGYKTGDIFEKYKENNFKIIGRVDNQIKLMGHRIELEEIENIIIKKYNIDECMLSVKKMKVYPHEKLVCYVTKKNKNKINKNNLHKLSLFLPYYMCPKEIIYKIKFKYNKNGKVDRNFYKELK